MARLDAAMRAFFALPLQAKLQVGACCWAVVGRACHSSMPGPCQYAWQASRQV